MIELHCAVEHSLSMTGLLTGHTARKFIVDFLRTIVVDSFSQQVSSKTSIILDVVLDVSSKKICVIDFIIFPNCRKSFSFKDTD